MPLRNAIRSFRDWVLPITVSLAILLTLYGVFVAWAEGMFTKDTAPAWVQAVGSVAAVFAAIWVSERQRKHAESGGVLAAQLVAVQISRHVDEATRLLGSLVQHWPATEAEGNPEDYLNDLRAVRDTVRKQVFQFKRETLVMLIPLPGRAAHRIGEAVTSLRLCERRLSSHSHGIKAGDMSVPMLKNLHQKTGADLRLAHVGFAAASEACRRAAFPEAQ